MADGFANVLEAANGITRQYMDNVLIGTVYPRIPLLNFLASQGGGESKLGRPGEGTVLGQYAQGMTKARKQSITGSRELDFPTQITGSAGGSRYVGPGSSNPTATNTEESKIADFKHFWSQLEVPISVDVQTVAQSKGDFKVIDIFQAATQMAMDDTLDIVGNSLWNDVNATPSQISGSAYLNGQVGMPQALLGIPANIGSTSSVTSPLAGVTSGSTTYTTYGGVDMSQLNAVNVIGQRVTAATPISFDLIEQANVDYGAAAFGPGVNLCLTTGANYRALKNMAMDRGGTIVHAGEIPEGGTVGIKTESIKYGKTYITWDPKAPTGYFAALTLESWTWISQPGLSFNLAPWKLLDIPGQPRIFYSYVRLASALVCRRPRVNTLWTNVA